MTVNIPLILISLAFAAGNADKPFWQINHEKGMQALKVREYADAVRYLKRALPKATQDPAARLTEVIAEINVGLGTAYKALAEGEHAGNKWSRKTSLTEASAAFRRARSWYKKLREPDDPIIMELTEAIAEVHELKMLDSETLSSYFGQRPDNRPEYEGVWEAYLIVLKDKEARLGPGDTEVIKYRTIIYRKLWNAIRSMQLLMESCEYEETVHNAKAEIKKLKAIASELKRRNKQFKK